VSDKRKPCHNCYQELCKETPNQAQAQEGQQFLCSCGILYEHICDESSGCKWAQIDRKEWRPERALSDASVWRYVEQESGDSGLGAS
jgi:hypothetical protein